MAQEPQIATLLIPCYVVQKNMQIFLTDDNIVGQILKVPCRNVIIADVAMWAVPVKDAQIFTTLYYTPVLDNGQKPVPQPTYDSFMVLRIQDKLSDDIWWVYVTTAQDFVNACSTCCGNSAILMPLTSGGQVIQIAPCDGLCLQNAAGQYYTNWGIPYLPYGYTYFPYGSFNNVPLTAAPAHGFPTLTGLMNFLNSTWSNTGSPNANITWTLSPDNLTLIATETGYGTGSDNLCVNVLAINPSQ